MIKRNITSRDLTFTFAASRLSFYYAAVYLQFGALIIIPSPCAISFLYYPPLSIQGLIVRRISLTIYSPRGVTISFRSLIHTATSLYLIPLFAPPLSPGCHIRSLDSLALSSLPLPPCWSLSVLPVHLFPADGEVKERTTRTSARMNGRRSDRRRQTLWNGDRREQGVREG
jgi:hypothetical protein